MKKTVFALFILFISASVTMGQKTTSTKKHTQKIVAPELVMTAFTEKFSSEIVPLWSKSSTGNFVATFDNNGNKHVAEFSPEGKLLHSTTILTFEQLTEAAQQKIKELYADMNVAEVKKIERDGLAAFYKLKLTKDKDNKTVYVNDAGFVKE